MLLPETGNEFASFNWIRLITKYLIESRSLLFLFLTEVPTAFLSFFVNENIKIPEYHYVSKVARNCNAIGLIISTTNSVSEFFMTISRSFKFP